MIITCINCNKKFEVDRGLIPEKGRYIQCGSCNHNWFFQEDKIIEKKTEILKLKIQENIDDKEIIINENFSSQKKAKKNLPAINKKNSTNFLFKIFSFLIVSVITIIAIIIVLDTFQNQLILIFPNLELILYNLFESIKDIRLFFNDLIR